MEDAKTHNWKTGIQKNGGEIKDPELEDALNKSGEGSLGPKIEVMEESGEEIKEFIYCFTYIFHRRSIQ